MWKMCGSLLPLLSQYRWCWLQYGVTLPSVSYSNIARSSCSVQCNWQIFTNCKSSWNGVAVRTKWIMKSVRTKKRYFWNKENMTERSSNETHTHTPHTQTHIYYHSLVWRLSFCSHTHSVWIFLLNVTVNSYYFNVRHSLIILSDGSTLCSLWSKYPTVFMWSRLMSLTKRLNRLHSYMSYAVKYLEDHKPVYTHCDRENVQQAACYRNMCLLRRDEERWKWRY
jgi:hypothetical protein